MKDTEPKICPILAAGKAISSITTETRYTTMYNLHYNSVYCMQNRCEWYKHGCPAYPQTCYHSG